MANRVAQIQYVNFNILWKHVPTKHNPADCASRGLSPIDLFHHNLWWSGPSWLTRPTNEWPQSKFKHLPATESEERRVQRVINCPPVWDLQLRYSSWSKLLRVTAYCRRLSARIRGERFRHRYLEPVEIKNAKLFWLKRMQQNMFHAELAALQANQRIHHTSSLCALVPYLDTNGLIRVKERLQKSGLSDQEKHPIVLRSHHLLNLIINETHENLLHGGPLLVLARLQQEYWILRVRPIIRAILHRCVPCIRQRAQTIEQLMGNLPGCRVMPMSRAFLHVGVDYAGPIVIRTSSGRGRLSKKAYLAIFVCMTTKAIHLDVVSDYSTAAFLAVYQRFISRRGMPVAIYSDNGTTFQGADREMTAAFEAAIRDSDLKNKISTEGVAWHFIPPSAPHFGGLWEAAVKSVKHHLRRCIGAHTLNFEEMSTLLCRIEACLNSRPLGALSSCLDDYQCLTPGHFLIGSPLVAQPEPSVLDINEHRLSRWKHIQRSLELFWNAWQQDYLHTLQQRSKWRRCQNVLTPGRMILIKTSGMPPSQWPLARIIACHPGEDGLIRVVTVGTSKAEYKRPISKICLLPIEINNAANRDPLRADGPE